MWTLNFFLVLLLQAPAPPRTVIVGFTDGARVVIANPEFTGFIRGSGKDTVLFYRQRHIHGQMPADLLAKIEFGIYKRGQPFAMTLTLRSGQTLQVESEYSDFISLRGDTVVGPVAIKHPDPISPPLHISRQSPDRKKNLTIQYLEFPGP